MLPSDFNMTIFKTTLSIFIREAACNLFNGTLNTRQKDDDSDLTDTDMKVTVAFRNQFGQYPFPLVIEEEQPNKSQSAAEHPASDGTTFLAMDPVDGTGDLARSQNTCTVAATLYVDGVPEQSVAAGFGIQAVYRQENGEFTGFPDRCYHRGFLLDADRNATILKPLYNADGEGAYIQLPPATARKLSSSSTLLVSPDITLPASYHNEGIRVATIGSTVAGQMQVVLGQADAFLFGPSQSHSKGNKGVNGPKVWDLIARIVANAGLVYVCVTGPRAGQVVPPEDLLNFCDRMYHMTEQLLVCHEAQAPQLLAKIEALKARLK